MYRAGQRCQPLQTIASLSPGEKQFEKAPAAAQLRGAKRDTHKTLDRALPRPSRPGVDLRSGSRRRSQFLRLHFSFIQNPTLCWRYRQGQSSAPPLAEQRLEGAQKIDGPMDVFPQLQLGRLSSGDEPTRSVGLGHRMVLIQCQLLWALRGKCGLLQGSRVVRWSAIGSDGDTEGYTPRSLKILIPTHTW